MPHRLRTVGNPPLPTAGPAEIQQRFQLAEHIFHSEILDQFRARTAAAFDVWVQDRFQCEHLVVILSLGHVYLQARGRWFYGDVCALARTTVLPTLVLRQLDGTAGLPFVTSASLVHLRDRLALRVAQNLPVKLSLTETVLAQKEIVFAQNRQLAHRAFVAVPIPEPDTKLTAKVFIQTKIPGHI